MSDALENTIKHLQAALESAKSANLGIHFESEINHLIATAKFNHEELGKERKAATDLPPCDKRKSVDGMDMCFAIGCCEIGDMPCQCWQCPRRNTAECSKTSVKGNR